MNHPEFSIKDLEYFFSDDQKPHVVAVVRRAERKRFPERPDGRDISFYFESLDFAALERKLNAYHAEFEPLRPGKARIYHHPGVEFLSVLHGKLELHIGTDDHILESGTRLIRLFASALLQKSQRETLQCDRRYRAMSSPYFHSIPHLVPMRIRTSIMATNI